MQTILHIDLNTLIYLGTTIAMCVGFVYKIRSSSEKTADVIKTELSYMKKLQEENKSDFKDTLDGVKEDFRETLDNVKVDLKEDISRLERKQSESNRIKERLAVTEHKVDKTILAVDRINDIIINKVLDKLENS